MDEGTVSYRPEVSKPNFAAGQHRGHSRLSKPVLFIRIMALTTTSAPPDTPTTAPLTVLAAPPASGLIPAALIFVASLGVFYGIWATGTETDIQLHTNSLREILLGKLNWPPNFLLYLTVASLSGFSTNLTVLMWAMILVLALSVTGKFLVTRLIVTEGVALLARGRDIRLPGGASGVAAMLTVVYLLPGVAYITAWRLYMFRIVPTVWHNSSLIAVFPFALLLFWEQFKAIELAPQPRRLGRLIGLVLLNILIKPSFFFVYAVATPLLTLWRERKPNGVFWMRLVPVVVGLGAVVLQAVLIYAFDYGSSDKEPSGLVVSPFQVGRWLTMPGTRFDLLFTFCLPLAALVLFWRTLALRRLAYPILLFAVGFAIFTSIGETGPRAQHGNFSWQNIITVYVLLLITTLAVAVTPDEPDSNWRRQAYWGLLGLHALSGVWYVIRILVEHQYK